MAPADCRPAPCRSSLSHRVPPRASRGLSCSAEPARAPSSTRELARQPVYWPASPRCNHGRTRTHPGGTPCTPAVFGAPLVWHAPSSLVRARSGHSCGTNCSLRLPLASTTRTSTASDAGSAAGTRWPLDPSTSQYDCQVDLGQCGRHRVATPSDCCGCPRRAVAAVLSGQHHRSQAGDGDERRQTGKVGTHEPLVLPRACGLMDDPWKSRSRCQCPTSRTQPPSGNTDSGRTSKT
mmetsp:Transcript_13670/g.32456  ORF Transcript_13670/g.32456 Transcript_13670/m.32456 type:complete len:236 (-) Transcript_13670:47-754(-)